jgi:LPS O-antigen subunit length determinant protein (WzzB/FepE family)
MSDVPNQSNSHDPVARSKDERAFVSVAAQPAISVDDDRVNLPELWRILWDGRWLLVGITMVFTVTAIIFSLTATKWYRAETLLAPADPTTGLQLPAQLASFAVLADINVTGSSTAEALAVLQSRGFTRAFIQENDLMAVLFPDLWDSETGRWRPESADDPPDLRDGVAFFDTIRSVSENSMNGHVTLAIEWTDPARAADWANMLVDRLNERMRQRAIRDAEAHRVYLEAALAEANVVALQQSIARLLETEMQRLMLAEANPDFAFRLIDRAEPPRLLSWPRRNLVVALGFGVGAVISLFALFVFRTFRRSDLLGRGE